MTFFGPLSTSDDPAARFDLLQVPVLSAFLKRRHARTLLQIPVLVVALVMVLHGLLGPDIAPKNLATVLTWVHFRGLLILLLLIAGNTFCMACPFMLVRNGLRRIVTPRLQWPRMLRNKWLAIALFTEFLFLYERFSLWSSPWWTAWLIVGYFLFALLIDGVFQHAAFCKYVCPIGQFNFVASLVSPLEVAVLRKERCSTCATKDCIKGRRTESLESQQFVILQRGCETGLFLPQKTGNMDCTFCLDCVRACPHENVGIVTRERGDDLSVGATRSGIGKFSRRRDLAALAVLFPCTALLNALGMVEPVYALELWLARHLHVQSQAVVLGMLFCVVLVVFPALLLASTALLSAGHSVREAIMRYSYALVPLGFGMWLAHYAFHLMTGVWTIIPVTQSTFRDLGIRGLGAPLWHLSGMPVRLVQPLQMGALVLGLAGSLAVCWRLAEEDSAVRPLSRFYPWACVCLILFAAAAWLMLQPMDMRATLMAG